MVRTLRQKVSFNADNIISSKARYFGRIILSLLSISLLTTPFLSVADNSNSLNNLSTVASITQDKHGFVWLAGQQGLTRVDGERSITFSLNNPQWPLPDSWIHNISLIDDNLLLATESNGLWLFDTLSGKSENLATKISTQSHFEAVFFKNNYYIYAPNKFYRFEPSTKTTQTIDQNISITKLVNTQNQLYASNKEGLFQLNNEQLIKIIDEPIIALTALSDAVIAITDNKIYRINDEGQQASIEHNEKLYGLTKAYHNDNFFTVNYNGRVNKYNGLTLAPLSHNYGQGKKARIRELLQDSSGVLWLVSSLGVEQLNESYIKNHNLIFDIPINGNEIALFDNEIIIGSYGAGLQNFLEPVFNQESNSAFTRKGLKTFDLQQINEVLYIGSFDGLWRYDKSTNQVTKLDVVADKLILKLEHKDNLLYIATDGYGLYIYDWISEEVINHIDESIGLQNTEVIDVLPLDNDKIWIAHNNKVSIYQKNNHTVTTLKTPNKSKVISLVIADNKIFASTLGDGILVFNQQGDLLAQLSNGHSFTEMLLVNNEIWASGKPGLYRISPTNYQVTMIENTQQYSFVSSMLVKDDTLYSIHYSGVLALNLSEQTQFNPNVVISKTTISGKAYLLNKTINIESGNDVITLDLASLDHRPGLNKKFKYRINKNSWQLMNNNQLTLTGLASGNYSIEIMATNSLGQWSNIKAYTEIHVAYPWYWTVEIRILYGIFIFFLLLLTAWLLYLRTKSIKHIHNLLKDDMRNYGRTMKMIQRNLHSAATSLEKSDVAQGKLLIEKSLLELKDNINSQEPDNLEGRSLSLAIAFLADHVKTKYQANLHFTLDNKIDTFSYELRADIYKVIFEALTTAVFKTKAEDFQLTLQEVKNKLWLTISSDNDSFSQLNSKINFDLASYTIRQITSKHQASLNTFDNDDGSSQLVISFPLMLLN
jgi:ligand-binding sensor domain-containing protein